MKNRVYCCFPGGKHKALTLSYDDGRTQDRRLVDIMNRYGIRGTFNLNSGLWERGDRIDPAEIPTLYAGHEVACHTVTHPTIARCPLPEVAQEVLASADGRLSLLGAMPLEKLVAQKGVGEVRAIGLTAALELGRRCFQESAILDKRSITSPELVYQLMLPHLKNLDHEECWALFLSRANFLLDKRMICSGSLESTLIDTRGVLKKAIEKQCSHIILVHNHPSGSPLPSAADIQQTQLLRKALATVEITLMDHVIVSDESFYSFSEERVGRC